MSLTNLTVPRGGKCSLTRVYHEYLLFLSPTHLEQTGMIPHLRDDDVSSGLSTKLLRQVVDQSDLTEDLIKYVVFKLPLSHMKKPYDASGINLITILKKTVNFKLIERLMELGMRLKESHMEKMVPLIPRGEQELFEYFVRIAKKNRFSRTSLNAACLLSMSMRNYNFITTLIEHGATPPPDELLAVFGFSEHPTIQQYLTSQTTPEPSENDYKKTSDTKHNQDYSYEKVCVCVCVCVCECLCLCLCVSACLYVYVCVYNNIIFIPSPSFLSFTHLFILHVPL